MIDRFAGFSAEHPLGADSLGHDQLSRVVHTARVSLVVSLSAVTIGLVVGGIIGTSDVGYLGGAPSGWSWRSST